MSMVLVAPLTTPAEMNNTELNNIADNLLNFARPNQESAASRLSRAANNIEKIREGYRRISNEITEDRKTLKNLHDSLKSSNEKIDKISQEINVFIHPPIGTKKLDGEELEQWKRANDKTFLWGLTTALFAITFFGSVTVACFGVAVSGAIPIISFVGTVISGILYIRNKSEMRRLWH